MVIKLLYRRRLSTIVLVHSYVRTSAATIRIGDIHRQQVTRRQVTIVTCCPGNTIFTCCRSL